MNSAELLTHRVAATGIVDPGQELVVALSGGRDSICLIDILSEIMDRDRVLAVVVHHGLRSRSADRDAGWAATQASSLGIASRVIYLDDKVEPGSETVWARDNRHRVLREAADKWGGPNTPIALAHTLSDQAETVLLRAVSSPGIRALGGMLDRDERGPLVRPLLAAGISRAETAQWCIARHRPWREDESNPLGPRGRVRGVLAALDALDGRAAQTLATTAKRAREDDGALRDAAAAFIARRSDAGKIPPVALQQTPPAVARRALRLLAERTAGRPCPRIERRLEEVMALDPTRRGVASLDVGDGVRVVVTKSNLWIETVVQPPLGELIRPTTSSTSSESLNFRACATPTLAKS